MRSMAIGLACCVGFSCMAAAAQAGDYRLERSYDLATGGSFSLRSEVGGITVRGGDGTQAVVLVTSDREDFGEIFDVAFELHPDRIAVVIHRKTRLAFSWFDGFHGRTHVDVTLPHRVSAEVHSSGGSVEVSDLQGPIKVGSSGGGVRVSAIEGAAHLESSGGSVTAENIGGDIEADSSGGGVRIEEAHGSVNADSSGGSVHVRFAAGNAHGGRIGSSGGGVEARVDPAVGLEIDASSSGGGVNSDLPVTIKGRISHGSLHGMLNGGGALLRLRSSGGGITLSPR